MIYLTFKDVKRNTQASLESGLRRKVVEALSFDYLLQSDKLTARDIKRLEKLLDPDVLLVDLCSSFRFICTQLAKHHGQPVVILIDEYDAPLQSAYTHGFYQPICDIMRNLFSSALKSNENLRLGVITGVLRIAKDSLFSGLNNLEVDTIL